MIALQQPSGESPPSLKLGKPRCGGRYGPRALASPLVRHFRPRRRGREAFLEGVPGTESALLKEVEVGLNLLEGWQDVSNVKVSVPVYKEQEVELYNSPLPF